MIRWHGASSAGALRPFVGGLLYGFSPFVAAQGVAHLFQVVGFIPPLVVLFLDRFFRTRSDPPWRAGLLVGACFVAELDISAEVFASMVVMAVVAAALWGIRGLLRRPHVEFPLLLRMGLGRCVLCSCSAAASASGRRWTGPSTSTVRRRAPTAIAGFVE